MFLSETQLLSNTYALFNREAKRHITDISQVNMQCNESQKQKSSPGSQTDSQLILKVEHTPSSCSVNNPSLSSGKTPMHCSQPNQHDHQSLAEE